MKKYPLILLSVMMASSAMGMFTQQNDDFSSKYPKNQFPVNISWNPECPS